MILVPKFCVRTALPFGVFRQAQRLRWHLPLSCLKIDLDKIACFDAKYRLSILSHALLFEVGLLVSLTNIKVLKFWHQRLDGLYRIDGVQVRALTVTIVSVGNVYVAVIAQTL
ncbi:MAG: hypothetical protein IJ766_09165 [Clostridia bacterium]|nr:hypothetical protein [Clostridia bacterium]